MRRIPIKMLPVLLAAVVSLTACGSAEAESTKDTSVEENSDKTEEMNLEENSDRHEETNAGENSDKSEETNPGENTDKPEETNPEGNQNKPEETNSEGNQNKPAGAVAETSLEESGIQIPELAIKAQTIPDTEAMKFVQDMKIGWNLGNTLDAYNDNQKLANELDSEQCWGNPATTQTLINQVQAAGFNTVRVPVTWHGHVTMEADGQGGFTVTISEAWLDRVQEVVDYAYGNGMYVIVNIHHDTHMNYCYPDSAHYQQSEAFVRDVWTAVSQRFQDYDQHLIFESINEPRLVGNGFEWNFQESAAECRDSADCINRLNQVFVDQVRESGGNNAQRYLMIPGYCASPAGVTTELFVLPEDRAEDKLIVSTHAYIPYSFALQAAGESGSTDLFRADRVGSTREIDQTLNALYNKFVSNGIPVVMGEFGARDKGENFQARAEYYAYYIASARARGITCCIWDNGSFEGSGELFGLFDRNREVVTNGGLLASLMKYA